MYSAYTDGDAVEQRLLRPPRPKRNQQDMTATSSAASACYCRWLLFILNDVKRTAGKKSVRAEWQFGIIAAEMDLPNDS